jgi:carboxyl-terminal processing protease
LVAINNNSASGAELVTGALKDYRRAVVVGATASYGKGTQQSVYPHLYGDMHITTEQYYCPAGASPQITGVTSDIIVPGPFEASATTGEKAMLNPIPADTIPDFRNEMPAISAEDWTRQVKLLGQKSESRLDRNKNTAESQTQEILAIAADLAELQNPAPQSN